MSDSITVNAAEIARLAGVGRAAVSNWRRRHADFPAPVGGTDASPLFGLLSVEKWLRDQGKLDDAGRLDWLWPHFEALGDRDRMGRAIAAVGARCLRSARAADVPDLGDLREDARDTDLIARGEAVAAAEGAQATFEFLRGRWLDTNVRQISSTPPELARMMLALARPAAEDVSGPATVLDPACGTGTLLVTALREADPDSATFLFGQESDATQSALAAIRLAFEHRAAGGTGPQPEVRTGDTLRADAFPELRADAVVCNPPFNERDWGHDELGWDTRWQYGTPSRTEPELAWVQHALARLRPGGSAVLLMPPAVASRRAGRRIRSALLQRGALRAVIALPPGAAPPHGVALHLWVLVAPDPMDAPADSLLLVDTASEATTSGSGRTAVDWPAVHMQATEAWHAFREDNGTEAAPLGHWRAVRVVDLLDDEVDLTPARHVPREASPGGVSGLVPKWADLGSAVSEVTALAGELASLPVGKSDPVPALPLAAVGELLRGGHLTIGAGPGPDRSTVRDGEAPADGVPVLTPAELLGGTAPRGWVPAAEVDRHGTWTVAVPGDVIVMAAATSAVTRVCEETTVLAGPQLQVIRPDRERIDSWFLAGCLRSPANGRQAGTHASTTSRLDLRRMQVPLLPLVEQVRYGHTFRQVDLLDRALSAVAGSGEAVVRALYDTLAAGTVGSE